MKDLIVKDNALINASYNLDLVEQRLILLAIVEARESGKGINANDPLVVHAESYINQFKVHRNTAYQALKDACNDLFVRQFSYQTINERGNVENYKSRWVSEIGYVEDEAVVKLIFSPAIVPLITRLEERFTKYELQQVSKLSSAYAIRLYELLISWRSTGIVPMRDLNDFRQQLGVAEDEYNRMYDFKNRVLEPAIKQINDHADIKVKYEQHKKGRSIIGFSFKFKQKTKESNPVVDKGSRDPNTVDIFVEMTDAQRYLFANKLSQRHEVGSEYAIVGESNEDFIKRLADMLLDPKKFRMFYPLLVDVGFSPKK
jgi:plasmid replication initiation protein